MLHKFSRTELLIGKEGLDRLKNCKVAIFGIGGVGSFVTEGLARAGIGKFILIDKDVVDITNINRQIHATTKTVGQPKAELMKQRILDINPDAEVETHITFVTPDNCDDLLSDEYDYIVDAIDTITSKLDLIVKAKNRNIPIISSMGAGNKLDPTRFEITDIKKTKMCPVAKVIRKELKKRNIDSLKVVYSQEEPLKPKILNPENEQLATTKRIKQSPGSISFIPSVVGLIIASEVVKDLLKNK